MARKISARTKRAVRGSHTGRPIMALLDLLASEALEILNASKITALIITDAKKPVGIIHLHDLLRAGVA